MDKMAGQSKSPGTPKPHGISDQIDLLRNDLSGMAEAVTALAREQLGETAGDVQHAAANKAGELQAAIRSNPMQSAAVAVGIGFFLGLIMTR